MTTRLSSSLRAILVLFVLLAAVSAKEAQPSVETRAQAIFRSVMSPYCPGQVLATCPSPAAGALRDGIRADLRAGRSAGEIEAALYRRFGDVVRATPQARGLGWLVWIVPAMAFLAGGLLYGVWLRRVRPLAEAGVPPPPLAPGLLERLDDELSRD